MIPNKPLTLNVCILNEHWLWIIEFMFIAFSAHFHGILTVRNGLWLTLSFMSALSFCRRNQTVHMTWLYGKVILNAVDSHIDSTADVKLPELQIRIDARWVDLATFDGEFYSVSKMLLFFIMLIESIRSSSPSLSSSLLL